MQEKFDFNDISLVPSIQSGIHTRLVINTKQRVDGNDYYPIIVSPMDTVISDKNYKKFSDSGLMVCIPRGSNLKPEQVDKKYSYTTFFSYSLNEFRDLVKAKHNFPNAVLIDLANGHIDSIPTLINMFKLYQPTKKIMVGNIANPETYKILSLAGADYIRCGIGGGSACLTSVHTSIHYPMGSLISECYKIKIDLKIQSKNNAYIVGDGGFRNYSDIIKGLALGADFIMVGSALNRCIESAGDTYWSNWAFSVNLTKFKFSESIINYLYSKNCKLFKKFRGMSTKEVQREWNKKELRASEGIVTTQSVEYTIRGWIRNLDDYLKSSMSYCNSINLSLFIGKAGYVFITKNAFERFRK